jgi:hypothetical protein
MLSIFGATLRVSGRPIMVLENGTVGTRWNNGEPAQFYFIYTGPFCKIQVAGEQNGWIGCNEKGFLTLNADPAMFQLFDSASGSVWGGASQGSKMVNLVTACGAPVLQFGGDDGFEDADTLYNFLIAAQKIKVDSIRGTTKYLVPTGDDSWIECPEKKPYSAKPASIELTIGSVGVPAA